MVLQLGRIARVGQVGLSTSHKLGSDHVQAQGKRKQETGKVDKGLKQSHHTTESATSLLELRLEILQRRLEAQNNGPVGGRLIGEGGLSAGEWALDHALLVHYQRAVTVIARVRYGGEKSTQNAKNGVLAPEKTKSVFGEYYAALWTAERALAARDSSAQFGALVQKHTHIYMLEVARAMLLQKGASSQETVRFAWTVAVAACWDLHDHLDEYNSTDASAPTSAKRLPVASGRAALRRSTALHLMLGLWEDGRDGLRPQPFSARTVWYMMREYAGGETGRDTAQDHSLCGRFSACLQAALSQDMSVWTPQEMSSWLPGIHRAAYRINCNCSQHHDMKSTCAYRAHYHVQSLGSFLSSLEADYAASPHRTIREYVDGLLPRVTAHTRDMKDYTLASLSRDDIEAFLWRLIRDREIARTNQNAEPPAKNSNTCLIWKEWAFGIGQVVSEVQWRFWLAVLEAFGHSDGAISSVLPSRTTGGKPLSCQWLDAPSLHACVRELRYPSDPPRTLWSTCFHLGLHFWNTPDGKSQSKEVGLSRDLDQANQMEAKSRAVHHWAVGLAPESKLRECAVAPVLFQTQFGNINTLEGGLFETLQRECARVRVVAFYQQRGDHVSALAYAEKAQCVKPLGGVSHLHAVDRVLREMEGVYSRYDERKKEQCTCDCSAGCVKKQRVNEQKETKMVRLCWPPQPPSSHITARQEKIGGGGGVLSERDPEDVVLAVGVARRAWRCQVADQVNRLYVLWGERTVDKSLCSFCAETWQELSLRSDSVRSHLTSCIDLESTLLLLSDRLPAYRSSFSHQSAFGKPPAANTTTPHTDSTQWGSDAYSETARKCDAWWAETLVSTLKISTGGFLGNGEEEVRRVQESAGRAGVTLVDVVAEYFAQNRQVIGRACISAKKLWEILYHDQSGYAISTTLEKTPTAPPPSSLPKSNSRLHLGLGSPQLKFQDPHAGLTHKEKCDGQIFGGVHDGFQPVVVLRLPGEQYQGPPLEPFPFPVPDIATAQTTQSPARFAGAPFSGTAKPATQQQGHIEPKRNDSGQAGPAKPPPSPSPKPPSASATAAPVVSGPTGLGSGQQPSSPKTVLPAGVPGLRSLGATATQPPSLFKPISSQAAQTSGVQTPPTGFSLIQPPTPATAAATTTAPAVPFPPPPTGYTGGFSLAAGPPTQPQTQPQPLQSAFAQGLVQKSPQGGFPLQAAPAGQGVTSAFQPPKATGGFNLRSVQSPNLGPPMQTTFGSGQPILQTSFGSGQPPVQVSFGSGQPSLQTSFGSGQPPLQTSFGSGQPPLQTSFGSGQPPLQSAFRPPASSPTQNQSAFSIMSQKQPSMGSSSTPPFNGTAPTPAGSATATPKFQPMGAQGTPQPQATFSFGGAQQPPKPAGGLSSFGFSASAFTQPPQQQQPAPSPLTAFNPGLQPQPQPQTQLQPPPQQFAFGAKTTPQHPFPIQSLLPQLQQQPNQAPTGPSPFAPSLSPLQTPTSTSLSQFSSSKQPPALYSPATVPSIDNAISDVPSSPPPPYFFAQKPNEEGGAFSPNEPIWPMGSDHEDESEDDSAFYETDEEEEGGEGGSEDMEISSPQFVPESDGEGDMSTEIAPKIDVDMSTQIAPKQDVFMSTQIAPKADVDVPSAMEPKSLPPVSSPGTDETPTDTVLETSEDVAQEPMATFDDHVTLEQQMPSLELSAEDQELLMNPPMLWLDPPDGEVYITKVVPFVMTEEEKADQLLTGLPASEYKLMRLIKRMHDPDAVQDVEVIDLD